MGEVRRVFSLAAVLAFVGLAAGCGQADRNELQELREQQRQVLAKLNDLERKIDQIARRAPQPQRRSGPDPERKYELPVAGSPIRGPENAPVTIVEFSDYQCPFCARVEPLIEQVLEANEGKVRLVYKHFPLESIHPFAMGAAKAAVAAQKQGKFWEMHEKLFANQRQLQPDKLKEFAREIGLDLAQFERDMNSPETERKVRDDMRLARRVGVRGTPTIFVGGRLVTNRSLDGFNQLIERALSEQKTG